MIMRSKCNKHYGLNTSTLVTMPNLAGLADGKISEKYYFRMLLWQAGNLYMTVRSEHGEQYSYRHQHKEEKEQGSMNF